MPITPTVPRERTPLEQVVFSAVNGWMTEFVNQLVQAADDVLEGRLTVTDDFDYDVRATDDRIGLYSLVAMARGEFYDCDAGDGPEDSPCPVGVYADDIAAAGLTVETLCVARPLEEIAQAVRTVWGRPS